MHTVALVPRHPDVQHKDGGNFPCTIWTSNYIQNTLARRVYMLDGQGLLYTVSRTQDFVKDGKDNMFSITFSAIHNRYSDVRQVEDFGCFRAKHATLGASQWVEGDPSYGLVHSHTVSITEADLLTHKVIHDVRLNVHISLDEEALLDLSRKRRERGNTPHHVTSESCKSALALNLVVVNNHDDAPTCYYVNIAGQVFRVPTAKHADAENGLWLNHNDPSIPEGKALHFTLEESLYAPDRKAVPPVTLFTNQHDASVFGNPEQAHKEKMQQKEHALLELKQRLEELKAENAKQKETISSEEARRKDYYDERSSRRKDIGEGIGIIPKVIAGAVGIFASVITIMKFAT